VNRPEDIKHVYSVISERIDKSNNGNNDQLKAKVVLRLREAILKSYIITGFPKVTFQHYG
jgi:hypothetical protein